MINRLLLFVLALTFLFACTQSTSDQVPNQVPNEVLMLRDSLKSEFAPDGRVAKFGVDIHIAGDLLVLLGETDQPKALELLINGLSEYEIQNKVNVLPDETTRQYPYAIVNNSVANLRSNPKHSAELATQAILGTAMKVLKITDEWYLVQTPDDYIAWVDHGGVQLKTEEEYRKWKESKKVIVTTVNATVWGDQEHVISDVVLGNILQQVDILDEMAVVSFPDGRKGQIEKNSVMDYELWLSELNPSGDLVSSYARRLMGVPYLWGGTSAKGMDCSGFTKTVYFMNGLVIPRDASQQVHAGKVIDTSLHFEGLEKGDLLFFGKPATDSTRQRTTHVGIWLGADEFIHASKRVRISSINPKSPNYDAFNKNRYLGSRRYLKNLEGNIEDLRTQITLQ